MTDEARREGVGARAVLVTGLLLTALAYLSTVNFDFVYDDHQLRGARVLDLRVLAAYFAQHLWAGVAQHGGYYRPVLKTWSTLAYFLFGQNTVAWHLAAIAMHLLVTWLVYLVVVEVFRDRLLAALAASVFGIHPVHVEVVAWISGAMSEGLLAALVMGSLLCYLRARRATRRPLSWHAASWLLFAAALLVKETAILLPLIIAAYEWTRPGSEAPPRHPPLLQVVALCAAYVVLAAIYVVVRHLVLTSVAAPAIAASGESAASSWMTLPAAAWFYLRELVWPNRLSILQPVLRVSQPDLANFWLPLAGAAVGIVVLIAVARRARAAAFGVCFLAAMLAIPLAAVFALPKYEIVHDRYLYLPSVGFSILVALAIRKLMPRMTRPGLLLLLAGIAVAIATAAQTSYWTNDLALYRRATAVAPNNAMAFDLLANEMYKRGDAPAALSLYHRALDLDPRFWPTNFSMGITECELKLFRDCEQHLEAAAEIDPENPAEFAVLADAQMRLGNYSGAEATLDRGISVSPAAPQLHYLLGVAKARRGSLNAAQKCFATEAEINPAAAAQMRKLMDEMQRLLESGSGESWRPGPDYP